MNNAHRLINSHGIPPEMPIGGSLQGSDVPQSSPMGPTTSVLYRRGDSTPTPILVLIVALSSLLLVSSIN